MGMWSGGERRWRKYRLMEQGHKRHGANRGGLAGDTIRDISRNRMILNPFPKGHFWAMSFMPGRFVR